MPVQPIINKRGSKEEADLITPYNGEIVWARNATTGQRYLIMGDGTTVGGLVLLEINSAGELVIDGGSGS